MKSTLISSISLAATLIIGAVIKDAITSSIHKPQLTSSITTDPVVEKSYQDEYCNLPWEIKNQSDSEQIIALSGIVSNMSYSERQRLEGFANLYSRFVIDMQNDKYQYYNAKINSNLEVPDWYAATQNEYDSLLNYYHYAHISIIKEDIDQALSGMCNNFMKENPKEVLPRFNIMRSNTQTILMRNYFMVFHKVFIYI